MKIHVNARALLKGLRVSVFCLITGPATLLFSMLIVSALQGSLSASLLSQARALIETGTPGQVWDCVPHPADSLPVPGSSASAGTGKAPGDIFSCKRQRVNDEVWAAGSDIKMKIDYLLSVFLSAIIIGGLGWLRQIYREVLNRQFSGSQKP